MDLHQLYKEFAQHSHDAALRFMYDLGFKHGSGQLNTDPSPAGTPTSHPDYKPPEPETTEPETTEVPTLADKVETNDGSSGAQA